MGKKQTIAVDIDDVIVATSPLVARHYNKKYGTKIGLKDIYSDDHSGVWGVSDRATAIARVEAYLESDEFQLVEPFAEAIDALHRLARSHELHVVTGRSTIIETATKDMLDKFFPDVFHSVTFTHFVHRKMSKADVCRQLAADVLIEDHLAHALPVAEAGTAVLLFGNYPWNQTDELPANVRRVKDWQAVLQYFNEQS